MKEVKVAYPIDQMAFRFYYANISKSNISLLFFFYFDLVALHFLTNHAKPY